MWRWGRNQADRGTEWPSDVAAGEAGGVAARARRMLERRPRTVVVAAALGVLTALTAASCRSTGGGAIPRADVLGAPREPDIRVRIKQGVASTKLSGVPTLRVAAMGPSGPVLPELRLATPVTLAPASGGVRATDGAGRAHDFPGPAGVQVSSDNAEDDPARRIRVDGAPFPGVLRIVPRQGRAAAAEVPASADVPRPAGDDAGPARGAEPPRLDVIEVVNVETYLQGVVPSEMFPDWSLGAFQVQAVAARTYALHERQRSIEMGQEFDVEASVLDQAYGGASGNTTAAKAVESTRGVVLTHEGRLLRAYYSSTCGGRPASAAEIWPTHKGFEFNRAAPLQARPREHACDGSKWYRWQVTRDRRQWSQQVRAWGERYDQPVGRLGLLERAEVSKRNAAERPSVYRLTDERGQTAELTAEELRVASNFAARGVPAVTNETRVRSGDLEVEVDGATVTIRGRGFGHGVGMCQYCARAIADRGERWDRAVLMFYPGAKLQRAY